MTETALQFGPEWMRALCDRGPGPTQAASSSSPTPASAPAMKYKLADYRYGREEMLLLFESNTKPSEELRRENPALVKELCQQPLALIPMTEEENILWATSVNSEAVLRTSHKDRDRPAGPGRAPPNLSERLPDSRSGVRGSGPPLAAGRAIGAAPGMRMGVPIRPPPAISSTRTFGYGRSFEEEPDADRREGFRGDVFKRGVSLNQEDQRNDRFRPEPDETKPRNRLDSRSNAENWRSAGRSTTNEGPNWRSSSRREDGSNWKGGTSSSSWREDGAEDQTDHRNGRNRYRSNDWEHQHHHNDDGSNLPEWSLDDVGTSVGTFDASGAFQSGSPGRELEDDGEGEWTSVRSNRTKRDREKEHHPHPDRQQQSLSQHRDDPTSVLRDSADCSHQSQSLQLKNLFPDRHDHDVRHETDNAATRSDNKNGTSSDPNLGRDFDEDFCSIEKLTESMVMKWTEEEEAKSAYSHLDQSHDRQSHSYEGSKTGSQQTVDSGSSIRWFYRDPQGEIQGPFMSSEMMEWYNAHYFQMNLLVRRSCDERFSQLGDLIDSCGGQIPFAPGADMPSIRQDAAKGVIAGQTSQTAAQTVSHPNNDLQIRQMLMYQQLQQQQQQAAAAQQRQRQQQQQLQQQQMAQQQQQQMQTQLRQLLEHLKRQDGFAELSQMEQQQVLLRQYTQLEQSRRNQLISAETAGQQVGRAAPPVVAAAGHAGRFPAPANSGPSIWELSNGGVMTSAALEEIQRREQEEQERKEEQKRKLMEDEQRRRHEAEMARKQAEEDQRRQILEQQRKRDEERKKEERAKQEEEMRRFQEEERIAEEKRREEQRRRHEEMRKLEEMARKQKEDAERCRQKEEEEKIRQMQKQQQEIERQRHEHETRLRMQQQQQQQQAEAMKRFQEKRGWGEVSQSGQLSLSEIQRLQEEKEFEERLEEMKQKANMRQNFYQNAGTKPSMSWVQAPTATAAAAPVKTLSEIQREEAEKLAKVRKEQEERNREKPQNPASAGIWSNAASQLSWKASAGSAWGTQSPTSAKPSNNLTGVGFWETDPPAAAPTNNHKQQSGSKDNSSKQQPQQSHSSGQAKQTSAKSRKAEESVIKLFESHRRSSDEFTLWCEQTLSKFKTALDVETFVAFLKGIESPFDVNDYVRSYLGATKDARDFAKQFLEKRSHYRNQEKQKDQEVMWGPAPAITPSTNHNRAAPAASQGHAVNSSSASSANNNNDENGQSKGGKGSKKKKNKRLVDTSLLGFTVQADPDRITSGEIESID